MLAERKQKMTKVSSNTGISRTTLTALTSNRCRGIQFDTLNTLCNYLDITPSDLLYFYPIDIQQINIDVSEINLNNHVYSKELEGTIDITVKAKNKEKVYTFDIYIGVITCAEISENSGADVTVSTTDPENKAFIKKMPPIVLSKFKSDIEDFIDSNYETDYNITSSCVIFDTND